jgi:hypothetical protein
MLRSKFALIIVMTALITLLWAVVTGCYYKTPEQRAEHVVNHLVKALKLDAVQTEKLGKIRTIF